MLIVVDTNVVVSRCINQAGPPARVLETITAGRVELVMSVEIRDEYLESLQMPTVVRMHRLSRLDVALVDHTLWKNSLHVASSPAQLWIPEDPDDNKFIAAAVNARADMIVSGDKHLSNLVIVEGIPIVNSSQFMAIFSSGLN